MRIYRGKDFFTDKPSVVTVGNFDGLHLGHMELVSEVLRRSSEKGYAAAVLSFAPHPAAFFSKQTDYKTLLTPVEKEFLLDGAGVDIYAEYPFDGETAEMTPEEFVSLVLVKKLNAKTVVVGEDFRFGKSSAGDAEALERIASKHGAGVSVISHKRVNGKKISSSFIKELILDKKFDEAEKYLGRRYFVMGCAEKNHDGVLCVCPSKNKLLPPGNEYNADISFLNEPDRVFNIKARLAENPDKSAQILIRPLDGAETPQASGPLVLRFADS